MNGGSGICFSILQLLHLLRFFAQVRCTPSFALRVFVDADQERLSLSCFLEAVSLQQLAEIFLLRETLSENWRALGLVWRMALTADDEQRRWGFL